MNSPPPPATDVDPVESPAGRKPDVREWRLIEPQPQARSPRKRCAGVAFAALGLCLAVFYGFDLHAAMAIRDDARLSRRVLGANVRSDYELTFPNHHSVNHSTQETLAATQNRIHFDGFMALLGAVLLVGGLGMYKANISPSRRDHVG